MSGGRVELGLDSEPVPPVAGTRYRVQLESSPDLRGWLAEGASVPGSAGVMLPFSGDGSFRFFRVQSRVEASDTPADGADLYGYQRIFREELRRVGYLTPSGFAAGLPTVGYGSGIDFDPRAAKYWDAMSADPAVVNQGKTPQSPGYRLYDFRLNAGEMAKFLTNGFVVSERLGSTSFGDVYYRVFADDLPVFISSDSVLHAWHYSYQRMLEELEELQLFFALDGILESMRDALGRLPQELREGAMGVNVGDADVFLAVARSLLTGARVPTVFGGDGEVTRILGAVASLEYVPEFSLFGGVRPMDFSQFKVRGHYERNRRLGQYFRAVMWLARADFRVFTREKDSQAIRELGTAVLLSQLLKDSGRLGQWQEMDEIIRLFVGRPDSMTAPQLNGLLAAAGLSPGEEGLTLEQLENLQQQVIQGGFGAQLYAGDAFYSPFSREQVQLPASFAFLGQRFIPDGWAMSQVTFDRILWNEDIPQVTWFGKVLRRYPSALDVAYSALGNRQAGDLIVRRMQDAAGIGGFRDGYPYAHNLTALAATFERLRPEAWEDSLYTLWLGALRALSTPTTGIAFPQAMRTSAWAMRTLNTQLGSYTELKHDTVLYAKQPYSSVIVCEYPAGYVEPVPEFWRRMKGMAEAAAVGVAKLSVKTNVTIEMPEFPVVVNTGVRQDARVAYCLGFAEVMGRLEEMARKELEQTPFSGAEEAFVRGLMNRQDHAYFGATYDGWYPGLFYKDYGQILFTGNQTDSAPCNREDPLVTDIHTAPPDLMDATGGVLHEATGNVDLLMIAVDNGPDRMVYAGPALSHYEFIVPGPVLKRLSDSEWKASPWPARPEWTRGYLVPKTGQ